MVKLCNSNKIIRAIRGNKPKFDVLKSISQEILEVRELKEQQVKFVEKVYDVILKNLASKKTEVMTTIDKHTYYVNQTGITKKTNSYSVNTENIKSLSSTSLLSSLVEVKRNLQTFVKVLSPKKRAMFKKFMEKAHLLEELKPVGIPMGTKIDWVGNHQKDIEELRVSYNYSSELNIVMGKDDWRSDKVSITSPDFKDYPVIEQLYNQLKFILKKELKQNTNELENFKKFLKDIDTKFNSYIKSVETLTELRKCA